MIMRLSEVGRRSRDEQIRNHSAPCRAGGGWKLQLLDGDEEIEGEVFLVIPDDTQASTPGGTSAGSKSAPTG